MKTYFLRGHIRLALFIKNTRAMHCVIAKTFALFITICCGALQSPAVPPHDLSGIRVAPEDSILATLKKEHPRLIATTADFERIGREKKTDPYVKEAFEKIYESGNKILTEPVSRFATPDGLRLPAAGRVASRITTLAFLYRLTKEKKFAERAWQELDAASQFPNWNPKHFLDVATMTYGFALGYDWLFDCWNDDQKRIIKSAIIEKGLSRALLAYEKLAIRNEGWWTDVPHNWNQVCNGGIGIGALAIADEEPALASRILKEILQRLPIAMKHFAPDGAWNEGPGYWSYATRYNVAVIAALKSALGTDFGLSSMEGFSKTGLFPVYNSSPINKSFNYADGGEGSTAAAQMFLFAREFNQPAVATYLYKFKPADPLALVWYDPELVNDKEQFSPDIYFREAEVVTMRSRWNDSLATFVACKAGSNRANHSHLDLGSFVLDALGERWILDLGADNYNIPAYFNSGAHGRRWTYYRTRAEGHNTLVIDPGNGPDQDPLASAKVTDFKSKPEEAYAVMDITPAYAANASSVKRGIALTDHRRSVVVSDEIINKNPAAVYWFAHTRAAITLSRNKKSAVLSQHGKKYIATIVAPANAVFTVMEARPLPGSPQPTENNPNKGVQKLSIQLGPTAKTNIIVVFHGEKGKVKTERTKAVAAW
jgi:hypothetical protein